MQLFIASNDVGARTTFTRVACELSATTEFCNDSQSSVAALEQQRFDIVVIDCDDMYRGDWLLRSVRGSRANKSSILVAITNGATQAPDAVDVGAHAVLEKPLSVDRVPSNIHNACNTLLRNQRSDRRYTIHLPIFLSFGNVLDRPAEMLNLSIGGLCARVKDPIEEDEIVQLRFVLPGYHKRFQARGEIAWADGEGNLGIRFIGMNEECSSMLGKWLESKVAIPSFSSPLMLGSRTT